jgi:GWxTD domain-containing protein
MINTLLPLSILCFVISACGVFQFSHNYYSNEQPDRTMKEKVASFILYIADDDEKETVDSLESVEDLNSFLVDFWLRRDPTPGTPVNEFKDEYVTRFTYANSRLGGWHTDRGRVYILHGPPEDIQVENVSHRFQGDLEIWIYDKFINEPEMPNPFMDIEFGRVKFAFLDRMGFGIKEQIYSNIPGEKVDPLIMSVDWRMNSLINKGL